MAWVAHVGPISGEEIRRRLQNAWATPEAERSTSEQALHAMTTSTAGWFCGHMDRPVERAVEATAHYLETFMPVAGKPEEQPDVQPAAFHFGGTRKEEAEAVLGYRNL